MPSSQYTESKQNISSHSSPNQISPSSMPDFWRNKSWRERAAKCCGIPVKDLGYAPRESSASADADASRLKSSPISSRLSRRRGSHGLVAADYEARSTRRSECGEVFLLAPTQILARELETHGRLSFARVEQIPSTNRSLARGIPRLLLLLLLLLLLGAGLVPAIAVRASWRQNENEMRFCLPDTCIFRHKHYVLLSTVDITMLPKAIGGDAISTDKESGKEDERCCLGVDHLSISAFVKSL